MAITTFYDSSFRFTDPVRYFKANDPYYYEVDNIPIKQLEENTKFLKDQVEGLLSDVANLGEISRSAITELKPYALGVDNLIRVKPGRYSARINDAYSIEPLQFIEQTLGIQPRAGGTNTFDLNSWLVGTNIRADVSAVLEKFKSSLSENALNMNGLAERAFSFPMESVDIPPTGYLTPLGNEPGYDLTPFGPNTRPTYPNYIGQIWPFGTPEESRYVEIQAAQAAGFNGGFITVGKAENEFIKRWRGVVRTAIVDVPEELQLEVPPFDEEDFFYYDVNGEKVLLNANYRIDLVFIYSKSIDQKSTTISKFIGGQPQSITAPTLGIVKGAGLGVNFKAGGVYANSGDTISLVDENGIPLMIPSLGDQAGTAGFANIKGSFPSPDDLMNITPSLSENLESSTFDLIGQSVLPVAYIVVRKTNPLTNAGNQILLDTDVIDIRPFFRTTELSYNERAGIAAATPQISLANPVASEGYVDFSLKKAVTDYTSKINTTQALVTSQLPRVIGAGYVKGGALYGVEGTLADFVRQKFNVNDFTQAKQQVISRFGYPDGTVITDLPDWDISEWCKAANYGNKGAYPNDYINFHTFGPNFNGSPALEFACRKTYAAPSLGFNAEKLPYLGTDALQGGPSQGVNVERGHTCIYFVKKRIRLDRSNVAWVGDYHVDVQLLNCAPLSCRSHKDGANTMIAANACVWVDKKFDEFTIFVSWVANDWHNGAVAPGASEPGDASILPFQDRLDGSKFAGFSVITSDIASHQYIHARTPGESAAGVAIYPTISFQIYGIPSGYQANRINANAQNPIITLR